MKCCTKLTVPQYFQLITIGYCNTIITDCHLRYARHCSAELLTVTWYRLFVVCCTVDVVFDCSDTAEQVMRLSLPEDFSMDAFGSVSHTFLHKFDG